MNEQLKKRLGAVRAVALLLVALTGLAFAAVGTLSGAASRSAAAKKLDPPALGARNYLGVLGLSADALAAAGVNAGQIGTLIDDLQEHLSGDGSGLQSAINAWGAANREADLARRDLLAGKGSTENAATKNTALASALAAKQSAINAAFAAATSQLDPAVIARLETIRANRPQDVPTQYLVVDRTGIQWRQLRDALSQKRQRDAVVLALDSDAANTIADADADNAVSAAAARIASNLAGIQEALQP